MKNFLLDTHVVMWAANHSSLLSGRAEQVILDVHAEKYVSIASAWEVAIKLKTGKIKIDGGLSEFYRMIDDNGFIMIPIDREHLRQIATLPYHHKDPFDRLLVTTAASEGMTLVTIDRNIHKYDVACLW